MTRGFCRALLFLIVRTDALQDKQLVEAAKGGDASEVGRLLEDGADPEAKDEDGRPALVLAAMHGQLDALKLLRQHRATLDATNSYGATALIYAASFGKADCTEAGACGEELLELGDLPRELLLRMMEHLPAAAVV
eukprot:COSAG04_NODE_4390_length_2124_cov_3.453333_3_plen_135_part_01